MFNRAYETTKSVAANVSDQVDYLANNAFTFNDKQQITELAGKVRGWPNGPTMEDLRERRPLFEKFLTDAQRQSLDEINGILKPYNEAARALNPELEKRLKLPDGGSYSHHAYVDTQPELIRTGASVGGKEAYEKVRKAQTMEQAIRSGRTPKSFGEATRDYIRMVGESAADRMLAEQARASLDVQTPAQRIPAELDGH